MQVGHGKLFGRVRSCTTQKNMISQQSMQMVWTGETCKCHDAGTRCSWTSAVHKAVPHSRTCRARRCPGLHDQLDTVTRGCTLAARPWRRTRGSSPRGSAPPAQSAFAWCPLQPAAWCLRPAAPPAALAPGLPRSAAGPPLDPAQQMLTVRANRYLCDWQCCLPSELW